MKLLTRVVVFVAGAGLLAFGWFRAHSEPVNTLTGGATTTGSPAEVLVVIGAFIALMAFIPSQQTVARWARRKRHAAPAHARRRRRG